MSSEQKAVRRFAHLLVCGVLVMGNIALVAVMFGFRSSTVRGFATAGLAICLSASIPIIFRPLIRWWRDPGSESGRAGPLVRGIAKGVLAIIRKWGRRCSPLRAQLLYDAGAVLFDRCRYRDSAAKLREAAALFAEMDDPLHQALALQELGNAENAARNYDESVVALERALALFENLAARQREDNTWRILNNLAVAYSDKGSLDEAERYCRRALQACRDALGADHPETALSLLNLADIHRLRRRFHEAEPVLAEALDLLDRGRSEHFAFGVSALAMLHHDQGHVKEAEHLYLQARELLEKQLGPEHADVARLLERHGAMLARYGRKDEGFQMLHRAKELLARAQVNEASLEELRLEEPVPAVGDPGDHVHQQHVSDGVEK
jgi:tetratricopeptide (TPR) repeat protein